MTDHRGQTMTDHRVEACLTSAKEKKRKRGHSWESYYSFDIFDITPEGRRPVNKEGSRSLSFWMLALEDRCYVQRVAVISYFIELFACSAYTIIKVWFRCGTVGTATFLVPFNISCGRLSFRILVDLISKERQWWRDVNICQPVEGTEPVHIRAVYGCASCWRGCSMVARKSTLIRL